MSFPNIMRSFFSLQFILCFIQCFVCPLFLSAQETINVSPRQELTSEQIQKLRKDLQDKLKALDAYSKRHNISLPQTEETQTQETQTVPSLQQINPALNNETLNSKSAVSQKQTVADKNNLPPPASNDPVSQPTVKSNASQTQTPKKTQTQTQVKPQIKKQPEQKKEKTVSEKNPKEMKFKYVLYQKRKYISLEDISKFYGTRLMLTKKVAVITDSNGHNAMFNFNLREGTLCGVKTYFLYPPYVKDNRIYISELDLLKVIDPVFRSKQQAKIGMKTIVIDAGHGGKDPGALSGAYVEKNINLQIAARLKKTLEKFGFRVIMTRSSDVFLELKERTDLVAKYKPDLFISIHSNASPSSSDKRGIETYCVTPLGASSTSSSTIETVNHESNAYEQNSTRLAHEIHKAVLSATDAVDCGVRNSRFYVITHSPCPAILLEVGYITNAKEASALTTAKYQEQIVQGILNGLAKYGAFLK